MNRVSTEEPRSDAARDLAEAIAVRQEGGSASADVLAQNFLGQVQRDIDAQVDRRLKQYLEEQRKPASGAQDKELVLGMALGSMGIGVPLSAIAAYFGGFPGLLVVWIGIILINVAWSQRR
jgi:hypothetical protein